MPAQRLFETVVDECTFIFTHHDNTHTLSTMAPSSTYVSTCLNPWVESPSGVADEFSMPTSCVKFRSTQGSATSTGGHLLTIINPWAIGSVAGVGTQFLSYGASFSTTTTTLLTYGDGTHPDVATINQNFDRVRTVSAGVKVYYTGAEQTTSGTLTVVPIISVLPSMTSMPTDIGTWTNMPGAKTVAAAAMTEPLCGAFHSYDRPRFHLGNDVNGNAWFPSFAIIGIGLQASSACIRVELEVNLEVVPKLITAINANSFQVAAYNDTAMQTTRRLDSARVGNLAQVISMAGLKGMRRKKGRMSAGKLTNYKRQRTPFKARSGGRRAMRPRRRMKKY